MPRSTESDLAVIRRAYAAHILAEAGLPSAPVERAFAAVPREAFLGRGPWQILRWGRGYVPTPNADPLHLYTNLVVAIRPQAALNNGEPGFHAGLMAAFAARPGEHVVHIGAGTGYFTALLAEQVGRRGRITAFEVDAELAVARRNLRPTPSAGPSMRPTASTSTPAPPIRPPPGSTRWRPTAACSCRSRPARAGAASTPPGSPAAAPCS